MAQETAVDVESADEAIVKLNEDMLSTIQKSQEKRAASAAAAKGYADQVAGAIDIITEKVHVAEDELDGESLVDYILGAKDMPQKMGNVELMARKMIDTAELLRAGWDEVEPGIATLYSQTFSAGRGGNANGFDWELDKDVVINVTPILPDGRVLSPGELEQYVENVISAAGSMGGDSAENIMRVDAELRGLILGVDPVQGGNLEAAYDRAGEAMERLHEQQAAFYAMPDVDPKEAAARLGEYFTAIYNENETLYNNMVEKYPKLFDLIAAGEEATIDDLMAALEELNNAVDDAT